MLKRKVLHVQVKAMLSGVQNMSLATINALKSGDIEFHLITGETGELTYTCDELGVKTHVIKSLKREITLLNDFRSLLAIRKYIKENEITLVHSHSTKPGVLCRMLSLFTYKVKFVHTVHGTVYSPWYMVRGAIHFMELLLAVLGSRTIVMRRLDFRYISFFGLNKKVVYLRNPISLAPKVGKTIQTTRLVFIGRLEYQKNPLEFMKLCHLLKDEIRSALVIGDGSLRSSMEAYAKQEELNCDFLGWNSDPWSNISSGDVLVCTSLYEGMPLVVLEALSRDVPVIAKEIPGVNDIFTDFRPLFMYRDLKELRDFTFEKRIIEELQLFNQKVLELGLYDASFRASQIYKGLL
jgi:glycosyltransferase involved in cell wall biosynthesis